MWEDLFWLMLQRVHPSSSGGDGKAGQVTTWWWGSGDGEMPALFGIHFPFLLCQGSENLFSERVPLTSLHPLELALQTHPELYLTSLMSDYNSVKLSEDWPSHHVCLTHWPSHQRLNTQQKPKPERGQKPRILMSLTWKIVKNSGKKYINSIQLSLGKLGQRIDDRVSS